MEAPKLVGKGNGPIINPALCRCCRSMKKCRLLTAEYDWSGKKEVYSEMFMDCFGLLLSHLEGDRAQACICATCVVRLRDACAFRDQVLRCERDFLNARDIVEAGDMKMQVVVKAEPCGSDCDGVADDHDADDDEPLAAAAVVAEADSKPEPPSKREPPYLRERLPRKSKTKTKAKRELLTQMQRLQNKLDNMLSQPALPAPKKPKTVQKKEPKLYHDDMVFRNAVTLAQNSYICPFHNRISNYYCYYCKDQFTNPVELREHTLTHDPKKWFEEMMEQKKIPKIDVTRVDCRLCDEKINDISTLKTHLTDMHSIKLYPVNKEFLTFKLALDNCTCTECGNSFPYFDSLKKHMVEHFGSYICDQCGACFLEQNSLRTHIKSHSKTESLFPCDICGKNLKSKYSRYMHIATVHEKKPTVNCYKCEASFLSYALRNRHLIEVHGDKRTFPCKLCDKVYNRRKTLMEHNRRNHLKVFRHQCDLCDQRFYLPSRLKEHMATHTGERNFRCEFCDKSYPRLQSLQEHVRSHSNERRYKCDICNSAFTQNGSLKHHMKSHHQGYEMDTGFN